MTTARWIPLVLVLTILPIGGCSSPDAQPRTQEAAVSPAPSDEAVLYVDVRSPQEYAAGHVEGALLIPHDEMEARWEELAPYRDRQIALYCRSGRRSGIAEGVLREKGFTNVVNAGAFERLRSAGAPVETGAD